MSADRDDRLAAALRALPVPEHRAGFFEDVEASLRTEAAEAPRQVSRQVIPPLRRSRRLLQLGTVAAAAAVVAAVISVGLPRPGDQPLGPRPASADEVIERAQHAVASARSLRGVVAYSDPESPEPMRWRFAVDASGSMRTSGMSRSEETAYDATTATERSVFTEPDGTSTAGVRTGLAPARPDPAPFGFLLQRELGSTVRALLASAPSSVRETSYDGRPAWLLETDVRRNALDDLAGDHLQVTVDRMTGFPVRVVESRGSVEVRRMELHELRTDQPVTAADLQVEVPPGGQVHERDEGFRRVPLDGAAAVSGYQPLVPAEVPDGYALAEVAVAAQSGPTGTEGINPPSLDVVQLAYRRGLDLLVVTTRREDVAGFDRGPEPCRLCLPGTTWADPLGSGEGYVDDPERVSVPGGALAGAPAELLVDLRVSTPHVWTVGDGLVVTVAGDATRAELLAVLGSLRRHGP